MNTPAIVSSRTIEPFWTRLPQIAKYPLQSSPLITLVAVCLVRILQMLPSGPFSAFINGLCWVAIYKYSFEVLRATANGRMEPPEGHPTVDDSLGWDQIKLQAGFIVLTIAAFAFLGPVAGVLVALFLAFALPGATMSLAIDQNLWHALNPTTWIAIMTRLGWTYFALVLLCMLFNLSQSNAADLLLPFLPTFLGVLVYYFLAQYVVIATFHLMGYVIYQYHEELGYEVEKRVSLRRPNDDPDQDLLDECETLAQNGDLAGAAQRLGAHLLDRGGSEAAHTRYRKLLKALGDKQGLLQHGASYLTILMGNDQEQKALDLVRDLLEIDPEYKPAQGDWVGRIARKAVERGQVQVAMRLLGGFHRAFPKHKDIPANYLLAAKLLAERMGQEDKARALLQQVLAGFPEHPLRTDIETYLGFLDQLSAVPKPS